MLPIPFGAMSRKRIYDHLDWSRIFTNFRSREVVSERGLAGGQILAVSFHNCCVSHASSSLKNIPSTSLIYPKLSISSNTSTNSSSTQNTPRPNVNQSKWYGESILRTQAIYDERNCPARGNQAHEQQFHQHSTKMSEYHADMTSTGSRSRSPQPCASG